MRKTKIVGTIGPSSMDYVVMKKMVQEGLNVVRINLSHANLKDMTKILENVKKIRKELSVPLPIMIDTRGPELRVLTFENGSIEVKKGQKFIFTGKQLLGNNERVSVNIPSVIKNISIGDKILACDGLITFTVVDVKDNEIVTKALNSGVLSNRKSLCIPGIKFSTPYLNNADKSDILWAIKNDVELIAASFVNSKDDVTTLRKFIQKHGGDMKIISKIESQCGVNNIDEIIDASDALMVARGDLGVEVPMEYLPEIQKTIIKKSVYKGKAVITATEMLESMIENKRPTRAEVSDIANAVYDGTSCVMLSGETASGKFPIDAVKMMASVAEETEKHINYNKIDNSQIEIGTISDVVSWSAVGATINQNIKLILSFTNSGICAGLISRFRPSVQIIGATPNEKVYRQLELLWGVKPILTPIYSSTDEMFKIANNLVKKHGFAHVGEDIVITCGMPKKNGGTNLIKIAEIE